MLARNLAPTCPVSDLFGNAGRHWLSQQAPPVDERRSVEALVRQLDFHGDELKIVDRDLAIEALNDPVVARLMTVPGIDAIVAISIVAAELNGRPRQTLDWLKPSKALDQALR